MCKLILIVSVWSVMALTVMAEATNSASFDQEHVMTLTRAQQLLAQDTLELHVLMSLRQQLAQIRDQAASRAQKGSLQAKTLEAQLKSLGATPEQENQESPAHARRRNELLTALSQAQEPLVNARSTIHGCDLLIREIDTRVRLYQAQHLLTRFPSPVLPSSWRIAAQEMVDYVGLLAEQAKQQQTQQWQDRQRTQLTGWEVALAVLLLLGGSLLMTVGQRKVVANLEAKVLHSPRRTDRLAAAVGSNVAYLLLPAVGLGAWALSFAVMDISLPQVGALGAISQTLPWAALIIVGANWLGHTLFSPTLSRKRLLPFTDAVAQTGVHLCQGLGVMLALFILFKSMMQEHEFAPATISVVSLPIFIVISLLLWRLATLFLQGRTEHSQHLHQRAESSHLLILMAYVMRVSAITAPLLVLIGLVGLARYTVLPLIFTLAELGAALFLYHLLLTAAYGITKLKKGRKPPILLPMLLVLLLLTLWLPLLAITWGAQVTDLTEMWYLLTNGVEIGDIRLSIDMVFVLVVVFSLGMLLTHWVQRLLRYTVLPRTSLDAGAQTAVITGVGYLGLLLAAMIAISTAGLNLASLAVVAGALSVGIGFGLQTIVSNFVSGIILLIERPIKEGDWIEVSGYSGTVRKIAVRSTRIETFDKHDVIVPNSDLIAGTVKNMTLSSRAGRIIVPVGIAYGSDVEQARTLLLELAAQHPEISTHPAPRVLFVELGDSALNLELRCVLKEVSQTTQIKSDLLFAIYQAFNRANIEIPYPQQDIHIRDLDRLLSTLQTLKTDTVNTGASIIK
ncbi:MAG: mechanosensitive ion channel [Candidatus Oceanisphaera merdipullorum]|nr:mechanosensitive ion channel [Candidatus Oceanisphaera merdipullorum]